MATRNALLASVIPFAHLLGIKPVAGKTTKPEYSGANDQEEADDGEEVDENGVKKGEPGYKEKPKDSAGPAKDGNGKAAKPGEDTEGQEDGQDGTSDSTSEEDNENADEDDADEDMKGNSASDETETKKGKKGSRAAERSPRMRERMRCKAIFSCEAAALNPAVAANLAFNTNLSRDEAIRVLQATVAGQTSAPGARRGRLDADMQRENVTNVPAGGPAPQPTQGWKAAGDSTIAAWKKATGKA